MAEETKPTNGPSAEEILNNAKALLATITKSAEGVSESQKQLDAAVTDSKTKLAEITAAATQAIAAKTKIADDQAVIATKSDHIQKAQEHADKVRADLDRALTAATQQATAAEAQKSAAEKSAETATELLTDIQTAKVESEKDAASVEKTLKAAEASAAVAKQLADKSETVETRIEAYETRIEAHEKRLAELDKQCADQLKIITDLLPGATTAGLAHSFDERRKTFLKPQSRWQWLFIGSILAIILLAASGLWQVFHSGTTPTYDELFRLWLVRLPIAGALVWLALHASRESALAKRLEEDYGYKSAMAEAFLGFHKQMSEVGAAATSNLPLAKLCEDTLTTIANPPGRIYDKHKLTVTPTDEIKEVAKAATQVASVVKAGPK